MRLGAQKAVESISVRSQAGFTLIELMVGILVSLICTLAIMAAFAVFEGQKRTTTSGNDAQQNGSFALYSLERQIRTAGSGLVQGNRYGIWGCPITSLSSGGSLPATAPAPFAAWPKNTRAVSVLISGGGKDANGNALPDIIGVVSGSAAARVFRAPVSSSPSGASVVLTNSFGIVKGDYLLAPLTSGSCALALSSTAPDASNSINFDKTNTPATGVQTATNVFDLGPDPTVSLYGVDLLASSPNYNSLVTYDLLQRPVNGQAAAVTPLADGIVMMKALYGIHDGSNPNCKDVNCIDKWVAPTAGGAWDIAAISPDTLSAASTLAASNAMGAIKAIRVVIVAQSRISQRSQDYVAAKPTLTLFTDLAAALQVTITIDPTYRYKIYDTTIPIRNALITKYF
jgi:type IV pilus assembly protein PilW